jgi:hypothetical protein
MSADTTVVIAAYRFPGNSELSYTAKVVQAVENLWDYADAECVEHAKMLFIGHRPWFAGSGGLRRAKQFAALLAEETRENGILEYENRPIVEIGEDRVYILSRHGRRKVNETQSRKPSGSDWMDDYPSTPGADNPSLMRLSMRWVVRATTASAR